MAKKLSPSNHNIPEAARKILAALNYYAFDMVIEGNPSKHFKTFKSGDATISIASSALGKPLTVTITKDMEDGKHEELLFHFDPAKKILLSAMQTETH